MQCPWPWPLWLPHLLWSCSVVIHVHDITCIDVLYNVHNMYMYYVLLGALQSAPKPLPLNTEQCEMDLECRDAIPHLSHCVSYGHLVMAVITVYSCTCSNSHHCMYGCVLTILSYCRMISCGGPVGMEMW